MSVPYDRCRICLRKDKNLISQFSPVTCIQNFVLYEITEDFGTEFHKPHSIHNSIRHLRNTSKEIYVGILRIRCNSQIRYPWW